MLSARLKQYYGRLRRPPGTHPLPGLPVIGHAAPATPSAGHRAGEGLSSSRRHHRYVPRPIRRGVLGRLHFQVFRAFRGLRPDGGGSALPDPTQRRATLTTPQASLHATDRSVAPPRMGFRHWASTPPVSRRSRQSATGPPGGYPDRTHTGKRRRADNTRSTTYTVNLLSAGRTE